MKKPSERSAHTEATRDPRRPLSADPASLGSGRFLALYEIGQQLLEQREPGQVLRTIHEAIVRHLQPDRAALLAASAEGSFRPLFTHELDLSGAPICALYIRAKEATASVATTATAIRARRAGGDTGGSAAGRAPDGAARAARSASANSRALADVAPEIDRLAAGLLGAHALRAADHVAAGRRRSPLARDPLGDPEVHHLGPAVRIDHHVE